MVSVMGHCAGWARLGCSGAVFAHHPQGRPKGGLGLITVLMGDRVADQPGIAAPGIAAPNLPADGKFDLSPVVRRRGSWCSGWSCSRGKLPCRTMVSSTGPDEFVRGQRDRWWRRVSALVVCSACVGCWRLGSTESGRVASRVHAAASSQPSHNCVAWRRGWCRGMSKPESSACRRVVEE